MKYFILLLAVFVCNGANTLYAQQTSVSGKVTDALDNQPLPGVTVMVKGVAEVATQTNAEGNYSIEANRGDVLVFQFVGMKNEERAVGTSGVINVSMEASAQFLQDVVVVGYGTQRRANLTGAVATIDLDEAIGSRPITDLGRGLQGVSPGLTITTSSGDLGRDANIRLRGITGSLNADGAKPLVLLDNVEIQSLQLVNPDDIESISVLKDAASASIYGTRAAWGVILITTKSGRKNMPNQISYSNNLAWATPTTTPKIASAVEGSEMIFAALRRTSNNPNENQFPLLGMTFDEIGIQKMREWEEQYGGQNLSDEMVLGRDFEIRDNKLFFYRPWDVNERYMKKWTPQQNHNLSFSGGGEKTSYNFGLGYLNQEGVLKGNSDKFDRYNLSLSVNSSVKDWLDVRGKVIFSSTLFKTPFTFSAATYGPWYYLYRWPAVYPYGTYEGRPFRSAVTETEQAQLDSHQEQYTRVSGGLTLKPMQDLTIDFDYTYSTTNGHIRSVGGGTSGINFWSGTLDYLDNYQSPAYNRVQYNSDWEEINTGKLFGTYSKTVDVHVFKVILGGDLELSQQTGQMSHRKGMIDPQLGEIPLATGEQLVGGYRRHWATLGVFGRLNYAYKDKYLLELNGRYDGSSRFPTSQQWGFFPSMSAGYVITQEEFMKDMAASISFLKIRGSWGSIGNQDVVSGSLYPFISTMRTYNSGWWMGDVNKLTVTNPGPVSSTITWETVTTLDFGLDARFFNSTLGLTVDWYRRTTSDMLTQGITVPATLGVASPQRNFGALRTQGWEFAVDWSHQFDNGLNLNFMGTLSDYEEKITKFANLTKGINSIYEGKILGEIWGLETDRFFTDNDFSGKDALGNDILKPDIPTQGPLNTSENNGASWFHLGPGDIKYKDLNNDGEIDFGSSTVDDHGDLEVIGNTTPRWQYGFRVGASWKGFDIDAFMQGVGSREFWASGPIFIPGYRTEAFYAHQTDYWTPENPNAFYPRITNTLQSNDAFNFRKQTKYLLDLSYLRMKNITFGYTLSQDLLTQVKFSKVRIFFSGENLFEFSNVDIPIDPEIDYTPEQTDLTSFGRVYPYRRTISFGLQLTL